MCSGSTEPGSCSHVIRGSVVVLCCSRVCVCVCVSACVRACLYMCARACACRSMYMGIAVCVKADACRIEVSRLIGSRTRPGL